MTTVTLSPGQDGAPRAVADSPLHGIHGIHGIHGPLHRAGRVLRAVRIFAGAAFSVAVLGTYDASYAHDAPHADRPRR